jgi:hypothetical protein
MAQVIGSFIQYSGRRLLPVVPIAFILLGGCASDPHGHEAETKAPPTADVGKLQAWHDTEMLANRGLGRSAAAGAGTSMLPIYGDNTMLVISAVPYDSLQRGMTVAYRNRRGVEVVHKLIEKVSGGWRVEGLNNDEEDPELVTPINLIGVVYATLNYSDDENE